MNRMGSISIELGNNEARSLNKAQHHKTDTDRTHQKIDVNGEEIRVLIRTKVHKEHNMLGTNLSPVSTTKDQTPIMPAASEDRETNKHKSRMRFPLTALHAASRTLCCCLLVQSPRAKQNQILATR